jgi:hypothetical protein
MYPGQKVHLGEALATVRADHRRFQQDLALPIPHSPDRIASVYSPNDFLRQLYHRMRIPDVARRRTFQPKRVRLHSCRASKFIGQVTLERSYVATSNVARKPELGSDRFSPSVNLTPSLLGGPSRSRWVPTDRVRGALKY